MAKNRIITVQDIPITVSEAGLHTFGYGMIMIKPL